MCEYNGEKLYVNHLWELKTYVNSHEWPRENFSLQYQYNIRQKRDEHHVIYQMHW